MGADPGPGASRRVCLFIATSLDGFIAGPEGEIDWLFTDADYGFEDFDAGIDTVFMGRRSYEQTLAFPAWPHAGKSVIVFSRRGVPAHSPETVVTAHSPARIVSGLRRQPGGNLWLLGGGELARDFLAAGLVDETRLFVHPVVLGGGRPLFPPGTPRCDWRLRGARSWPSGLVELSYDCA